MRISKIEYDGMIYPDMTVDELVTHGLPASDIGQAAKANAMLQVVEFAESYRSKIASQSAGKLAEYRIKEEIARNPESASDAELEILSREAKARGSNRTGLLGQISKQATAYRKIALLIGALEAEAGAAISAIPDDANDIADLIASALFNAKSEADAEYQNALAMMVSG